MRRAIFLVLLAVTVSIRSMAQNNGQSATPVSAPSPETSADPQTVFTPMVFRMPEPRLLTSTRAQSGTRLTLDITSPRMVVKGGAVFYEMFGGMLIPVPGGGASGCFGENLTERIETLRKTIEKFPALAPLPPR